MVNQKLYTVFDNKAALYLPPFGSNNHGTATRQFANAVLSDGHDFNRNADDFSLWCVGEWIAERAELVPAKPEMIASGAQILAAARAEQTERASLDPIG